MVKSLKFLVTIFLILIPLSIDLEPKLRRLEPEKPISKNSSKIHLSGNYSFHKLEKRMKESRTPLMRCFLKNEDSHSSKVRVRFLWEGTGHLSSIEMNPDFGDKVRDCIFNIANNWNLDPHPGMKPFSYSRVWVLQGR